MRRSRFWMLAAAAGFVAHPALAQAPLMEKNISMAMAMAIIQGTVEQCTKDGYKVSVTVVDRAGNIAASLRGDGTNPHTLEFSRLKAYTSRTRGQTSGVHEGFVRSRECLYAANSWNGRGRRRGADQNRQ